VENDTDDTDDTDEIEGTTVVSDGILLSSLSSNLS
jgi:hypothetical protein